MACLLAVLALFSPRLALVAMWLFGDLLGAWGAGRGVRRRG